MARDRKYKCRCCKELFSPDHRNRGRQHYCKKPACRAASRKASQAKWVRGKGRSYFKGKSNVKRVQAWRELNPDYSLRTRGQSEEALQDPLPPQTLSPQEDTPVKALQDSLSTETLLMLGFMAHFVGGPEETLQDSIEALTARLRRLGSRLLEQGFPVHLVSGGSDS